MHTDTLVEFANSERKILKTEPTKSTDVVNCIPLIVFPVICLSPGFGCSIEGLLSRVFNKDIEQRQTQWRGQCICYMCKDNKDIEWRQTQWRGQCICYMCKDNKDTERRQTLWQGQCICYMCKDNKDIERRQTQ